MTDYLSRLNLSLLHCGFITLGAEWQFNGVISPFCRLYLITEGEAFVWHHQQKFTLKPGYLYLIPSFSPSRYHCETSMTQYYISFLEETESGLSIFDVTSFDYEITALALDPMLFDRLVQLNPGLSLQNTDPKAYDNQPNLLSFNQPGQGAVTNRSLETQGILYQLLSRFLKNTTATTDRRPSAHLQLRAVLSYIHTHLQEKISIDQLATIQNLNVDYFSRQFQSLLGIRPLDYIINKRLERAQLLMTTTELPLQEITERVGISDIYYFSRLFKRQFGESPGRFRKRLRQV